MRRLFRRTDTGRFTSKADVSADPAGTITETREGTRITVVPGGVLFCLEPNDDLVVVMRFEHELDDDQRRLITEAHAAGLLGHRAPYSP